MSDLEGVMLSDYLLLTCISRGGVADVYRARQSTGEGNYEVAVKVFRPGYAQRASFRDYFMERAEKVGLLEQRNILPLLEYGEGEDLLYVVTPFVATGTLETLLKRVGGRFSAMQATPIMQQLCDAVQYAHNAGVIHGNIKPSNIFVTADGRILLSDFSIARGYDDSQQSLTRVGWGSAEYAAPEQSLGLSRPASDIYSLGVLLFRILTGYAPFIGQTPVEVLLKHVRQEAPSARSFAPNISHAVDDVLSRALQKRTDDRFASADEFARAFLAAVAVAPTAPPLTRPGSGQLPSTGELQHQLTPAAEPGARLSSLYPQTPVPAYIALDPPGLLPLVPHGEVTQHQFSQAIDDGEMASDVTEVRRVPFPRDGGGEKAGHMLWSVDPAEWSPIAKDQGNEKNASVPLTASEYLNHKPLAPQERPATWTANASGVPTAAEAGSSSWLRKLLPIIVVILLLLGLLGALFSAFLFPTQKPGTGTGAVYALVGVSATGAERSSPDAFALTLAVS
jgi:serine/threonine protein kinase